eukprot:4831022-Amphidinium_carterae.1
MCSVLAASDSMYRNRTLNALHKIDSLSKHREDENNGRSRQLPLGHVSKHRGQVLSDNRQPGSVNTLAEHTHSIACSITFRQA